MLSFVNIKKKYDRQKCLTNLTFDILNKAEKCKLVIVIPNINIIMAKLTNICIFYNSKVENKLSKIAIQIV